MQYETGCTGKDNSVHSMDIEGYLCQFCGIKIKFNEYTKFP